VVEPGREMVFGDNEQADTAGGLQVRSRAGKGGEGLQRDLEQVQAVFQMDEGAEGEIIPVNVCYRTL